MSASDSRAVAGLDRTVPALPVRDVGAAVAYYRERFGFDCPHETSDFAVVGRDVDALFAELERQDVLHPTARSVESSDFGTREFPTVDLDGNLLTFFHWESA